MIFTLESMPKDLSDPQCLVKGFNNETTPSIFEQAVSTNEERNTFFYFFKNLDEDKTFNPSLGELRAKVLFLKKYIAFLKAGQQSNYNFHFRFRLFLNGPKGHSENSHLKKLFEQLTPKDPSALLFEPKFALEKNLLAAHLFHVYTFFLGVQKFVFRKVDDHMRTYMKTSQFNSETFEFALEALKLGLGRVLKLSLVRDSLLGFFVNEQLPEDFSLGTLSVLRQIYEINFVNLLLYKIMFRNDNYKSMGTSTKFITVYIVWFQEAKAKVHALQQVLPSCSFNWKNDLARFLGRLKVYYELMHNTFIMRYNFLLEKEKDKCLETGGRLIRQVNGADLQGEQRAGKPHSGLGE